MQGNLENLSDMGNPESLPADPGCKETGCKKTLLHKKAVYDAIVAYIEEHQYPPSVREICKISGLKSTSSVHGYIKQLIQEGYLETDSQNPGSRALRVSGYKFVKVEAEDQGNLKLPCKVGDIVYEVQQIRHRIQPLEITSVCVGRLGEMFFNWELKDGIGIYQRIKGFGKSQLGKTVFLTQAEAEEALARMDHGRRRSSGA